MPVTILEILKLPRLWASDDIHVGIICSDVFQSGSTNELECGPMPSMTAALPNIGGALCVSSEIPFLVPYPKVWLTPLLECHAVTLPI